MESIFLIVDNKKENQQQINKKVRVKLLMVAHYFKSTPHDWDYGHFTIFIAVGQNLLLWLHPLDSTAWSEISGTVWEEYSANTTEYQTLPAMWQHILKKYYIEKNVYNQTFKIWKTQI